MAVISNYQRMQLKIIGAWLVSKTQCILWGHTQLVDFQLQTVFSLMQRDVWRPTIKDTYCFNCFRAIP